MNKFFTMTGTACLLAVRLLAQDAPPPAANPATPPVPGNPLNDAARLLAGLAPLSDPAAIALSKESSWQQHAKFFDAAWAKLEKNQLLKVRTWAKTNIPDAYAAKGTMFYMFSGPDYLYADTFFPQANTYVLCGIEPVGPLPNTAKLNSNNLAGELHALQNSLNSVLNLSFFITKHMKDDLQNHMLSGTLPVLYIFLARQGKTLSEVSYVSLDEEGALTTQQQTSLRGSKCPAPGVRIQFLTPGSTVPNILYYFSTDISNDGLKRSGFLKFCKNLAPGVSCVKSASYLMHESYFSTVRSFLLENASTLVQDDSGIPISFFAPESWEMRYFGSYPGPIPLFKDRTQPKLTEIYRTTKPAALDFGIGYRYRASESTLMVATRKAPGASQPQPKAAPEAVPPRATVVPNNEATKAAPEP